MEAVGLGYGWHGASDNPAARKHNLDFYNAIISDAASGRNAHFRTDNYYYSRITAELIRSPEIMEVVQRAQSELAQFEDKSELVFFGRSKELAPPKLRIHELSHVIQNIKGFGFKPALLTTSPQALNLFVNTKEMQVTRSIVEAWQEGNLENIRLVGPVEESIKGEFEYWKYHYYGLEFSKDSQDE